jgi:hypothetical protein
MNWGLDVRKKCVEIGLLDVEVGEVMGIGGLGLWWG